MAISIRLLMLINNIRYKVYFVGSITPAIHMPCNIHKLFLYYSESEASIQICFMLEEWFPLINWHFKVIFQFSVATYYSLHYYS